MKPVERRLQDYGKAVESARTDREKAQASHFTPEISQSQTKHKGVAKNDSNRPEQGNNSASFVKQDAMDFSFSKNSSQHSKEAVPVPVQVQTVAAAVTPSPKKNKRGQKVIELVIEETECSNDDKEDESAGKSMAACVDDLRRLMVCSAKSSSSNTVHSSVLNKYLP